LLFARNSYVLIRMGKRFRVSDVVATEEGCGDALLFIRTADSDEWQPVTGVEFQTDADFGSVVVLWIET
jgi:hypothetical protein